MQLLGPSSRSHRSAFLTQSSEEHIPPSPDYWLLPWLPFLLQSLPSSLFILPPGKDLGSMSFPVGFNLCSLFQGLYSPHQPDLLISHQTFLLPQFLLTDSPFRVGRDGVEGRARHFVFSTQPEHGRLSATKIFTHSSTNSNSTH